MRRIDGMACAALLLGLLGVSAAFGQSTINATLGGTVADASGALIPGVEITATNTGTGIVSTTVSNETGTYQFPSLQSGVYRVSAVLPGFQTQIYDNVSLGIAQQVRLNFRLEVGTVTQTVEVTVAADTLLATTATSVQAVLSEAQVTELPLAHRDALRLVATQIGVRAGGMTDESGGAVFAGTSPTNVNTVRDGISVNDTRHNDDGAYSVAYTSPDLVEEVRVIVAAADAEFGRGGGQVQMATRSGTNEFRGSLFYTNRNSALNASTWANNRSGAPKNYENRNQFGGRLGGPIVSNKTFFFFLYDGQRYITKESVVGNVLTESARNGIFRYFPGSQGGNASIGANASVDPSGNPVRPANATGDLREVSVFGLDPNRPGLDPSGWVQRVIERMPLPNDFRVGDGLNTAGYRWTLRRKAIDSVLGDTPNTDRDQINLRVDHYFNQNHNVFFTMTEEWSNSESQISNWPNQDLTDASMRGVFRKRPRIYTASFISTLSPTVINEFRFGMRSLLLDAVSGFERSDANGPELMAFLPVRNGIPFIPKSQLFTENVIFGGFNGSRGNTAPRWSLANSTSWNRGAHSFKGGFEWGYTLAEGWTNQQVYPYANLGAGAVGVQGFTTANFPGAVGASLTQATTLLTDLSGSVDSVQQAFVLAGPNDIRLIDVSQTPTPAAPDPIKFFLRDWRQRDFSWFFKDDWKATSNLTLNLGLRWEWYGPAWDNYGMLATPVGGANRAAYGISGTGPEALWRPGLAEGELVRFELIGPNSPNPDRQLWKNDWNNFAPAVGFSWSLPWLGQDQTVLRVGYGVNFTDRYDISTLHNGQFATPGTGLIPNYRHPALMTLNDLPVPVPVPDNPFDPVPLTSRSSSIRLYDEDRVAGYVQSFNVSLQRALTRNLTFEVQYLGTKGTKMKAGEPINTVNIFENGLLEAFNVTRTGGNAPLFDQMFNGLNLGLGPVNGTTVTGSASLRENSIFRNFLANGDVGQFAQALNQQALFGLLPGGVLRRANLPENFIVVNPQFSAVTMETNANNSTYHSLNLVLSKRLSDGYSSQFQYTWSRNLGLTGGENNVTYLDPRNKSLNKSLLPSHRTHEFRMNNIVQLPFGPGRFLLGGSSGVLARIVEGWQLSTILSLETGQPLTVTASTSSIHAGTGNTPLIMGDFSKSIGKVVEVEEGAIYFEGLQQVADPNRNLVTTAQNLRTRNSNFAIADAQGNILLANPLPGQLGTLGQNWIEGPGSLGLDAALSKSFRIDDNKNFEIRVDAVNVLNRPNWGNPTLDINSTNFGRITSASGNRSVVLNARLNF